MTYREFGAGVRAQAASFEINQKRIRISRGFVRVGIVAMLLFALAGVTKTVAAQGSGIRQRITQAIDERQTKTLKGNVHPLAQASFDRGAAPDDLQLNRLMMVLQRSPEQESALQELMQQQQTKGSANYQKWLTPAEFGAQFGPSDADVATVTGWLGSHGFQVTKVNAGKTIIEFSGNVAQVRSAFHTQIRKFVVNGEQHWANDSDPQIPAAIAPVVAGIHSLHNFYRKPLIQKLGVFQKSKKDGTVTPLFTFTGPNSGATLNALGPTDFATIYNVLPLWNSGIDGTGQHIAIVGETNINCQDVVDFRNHFNLPATISGFTAPIPCNGQNWPVNLVLNGPDPGITDEETEADLDVQWAGAVAKNAVIDFVISESTETEQGVDLSAIYIVDNNLAPVISESFGACEANLGNAGNQFYNAIWEQAASQGISVFVSSGDAGAAGCDNPNGAAPNRSSGFGPGVNGLASTLFNTAVGGTDFDLSVANYQATFWNTTNDATTGLSAKSYVPETTWDDSCARKGLTGCVGDNGNDVIEVGGGGGPSNCATLNAAQTTCLAGYAKPSWQSGAGVPNDNVRDTPDISLFAADGFVSGSFYIVCQSDQDPNGASAGCNLSAPFTNFIGVGGTSSSAPAFAGIMALVNQNMLKLGKAGAQGNANFTLYRLAAQPGASCTSASPQGGGCIFNDVVKGNISVPCVTGSFDCGGAGVLVDTNYSAAVGNPAYNATAGYDMATGLGSVNATNLVNAWPTVSFNPTISSLILTPSTTTHGQPVTVTIGVASTSAGTPSGDVSLIGKPASGAQFGIDGFTLDSTGKVTSMTSTFLPGGTYPVNAHYAGDGVFGGSDSNAVPVTVNPETSATNVSLLYIDFNGNTNNAATSQFGTLYGAFNLIRVDVAPTGKANCASTNESCATGNITLNDNGQPFDPGQFPGGQLKLNSLGYAEAQTTLQGAGSVSIPALSVGTHSFTASFPGDPSFNASASPAAMITVSKAPTTIKFSPAPPSVQPNVQFTTTIVVDTQIAGSNPTAGSYGNSPSGNVVLMNGGTQIGTAALVGSKDANGFVSATATITATVASVSTITASYSGDANYVGASTVAGLTVSASPSAITIATPGQPGTSTVTVTATNGFTGNASLTCSVSPTTMTAPPTCNLSRTAVSLTVNSPTANSTLTVGTTAGSLVGPRTRPLGPVRLQPVGWIALVMASGLLALGLVKRRRSILWVAAPVLLLGVVAAGCGGGGGGGGGNSTPGTAAGTYTVTITATSGSTVQSATVTVTVQ